MLKIISRAEWGARPPRSRVTGDTVRETFLHHSAGAHSGAAGVRSIQIYHQDRQGWSDIAYNFLIDPHDFRVYEGRGWGVRPGSQKAYNTGTWSVCVLGNFQTRQPTQGLLDVVANLIRTGHQLGHIPLVLTGGHKDAPGQATSCPGLNLHREIPSIRLLLEEANVKPPTWARDATQWHIDRGIYTASSYKDQNGVTPNPFTPNHVDEDFEFHRQSVFRHRFYNAIRSEFGSGPHHHDGRYIRDVSVSR